MIEAEHVVIVVHPNASVEMTLSLVDSEISQEPILCVEQELAELVVSDVTELVVVPMGSFVLLGPGCTKVREMHMKY